MTVVEDFAAKEGVGGDILRKFRNGAEGENVPEWYVETVVKGV